jgi:hypothetical protein
MTTTTTTTTPARKRFQIVCRNGNSTTVQSLREAREICIHLHPATVILDQFGNHYPIKP